MKKKILAVLIVVFIMSTSISADAETKTITAQMKAQTIVCNGVTFSKIVIEYEGTNYVPVREIANMLGVSVSYVDGVIHVGKAGSAIATQTITPSGPKFQKVTAQLKKQHFKGENIMGMTSMIVYKGTSYVAVREFGKMVHTTVSYEKGIIYIGEANATVIAKNKSDNQSAPVPIGTTQIVTTNYRLKNHTASICVEEMLRGEAAWEILKENKFNKAAPEGKEYIIARISFELISVDDGNVVSFSSGSGGTQSRKGIVSVTHGHFEAYGSNNVKYGYSGVVSPTPMLSGQLSPGDYTEGWGVYMVDQTDTAPKLLYGHEISDGKGGVWFSLYEL